MEAFPLPEAGFWDDEGCLDTGGGFTGGRKEPSDGCLGAGDCSGFLVCPGADLELTVSAVSTSSSSPMMCSLVGAGVGGA